MKKLLYFSIAMVMMITSSCEKVIPFDIPEAEPLLVVNSYIDLDTDLRVDLSSSLSYLDSRETLPGIQGADISLWKGNTEVAELQEDELISGRYWLFDPLLTPGEYELRVETETFGLVTTTTEIPEIMENVIVEFTASNEEEQEYEFNISFEDDPETEDYYHLVVMYNDEFNIIPEIREFYSTDEVFLASGDSDLLDGRAYYYRNALFSDEFFGNSTVNVSFGTRIFEQELEGYSVQLVHCSKDYYDYHNSFLTYLNSDGFFTQPVQVYTNVEGGLGVFAGYNVVELPLEF